MGMIISQKSVKIVAMTSVLKWAWASFKTVKISEASERVILLDLRRGRTATIYSIRPHGTLPEYEKMGTEYWFEKC